MVAWQQRVDPRAAWGGMAALALLSGALSSNTFDIEGPLLGQLWPGLWYGGLLGVYLLALRRMDAVRAVAFLVLVTISWYAAYRGAYAYAEWTEGEMTVAGLVGGAVGGVGMAATAAALFREFRNTIICGTVVATGAVMGTLLVMDQPYVLFCGWQGTVATVFGYGLFLAPPPGGARQ